MKEQWKPIPGFPDYEVSNTGLVRSYKGHRPRILKPSKDTRGYRRVILRRNGKSHTCKIGHLVLSAFRGPCPENYEICHNDGNATNDCLDNLRWDTHVANMQDAAKHNVEKHIKLQSYIAIRNRAFVNAVRVIQRDMGMSQAEFSEHFGITQGALSKFYTKGIKDGVLVKILRKFPDLVHVLISEN